MTRECSEVERTDDSSAATMVALMADWSVCEWAVLLVASLAVWMAATWVASTVVSMAVTKVVELVLWWVVVWVVSRVVMTDVHSVDSKVEKMAALSVDLMDTSMVDYSVVQSVVL